MAVPMYHYYLCNSSRGKVLFQILRPGYQNAVQASEDKANELVSEKLIYLQYHYVSYYQLNGISVVGEYIRGDEDEDFEKSLMDYELRLFQKADEKEQIPEKLKIYVRRAEKQYENYPFQILQIQLEPSMSHQNLEEIEVDFWTERKFRQAIQHLEDHNVWNIELNPDEEQFYW